ncbi:MAG: hypothetical protein K0U82_23095 [Planctomycetes bacterium]|nr:hypothetical protein [Planctomycetota bacterium]
MLVAVLDPAQAAKVRAATETRLQAVATLQRNSMVPRFDSVHRRGFDRRDRGGFVLEHWRMKRVRDVRIVVVRDLPFSYVVVMRKTGLPRVQARRVHVLRADRHVHWNSV